jgi:hypothetical protein
MVHAGSLTACDAKTRVFALGTAVAERDLGVTTPAVWSRAEEIVMRTFDSTAGIVASRLDKVSASTRVSLRSGQDLVRFELQPNPGFHQCLAQYPDDPNRQPCVHVLVVRGSVDDGLFLLGMFIKPHLKLALFTVEQSPLRADGSVDPAFGHFGLAWYQTHLEADAYGVIRINTRNVLLDHVSGLDSGAPFSPTGTFHVGLWFDEPAAAAAAGHEVTVPPFRGERRLGPLAMISAPNSATGLGPLCTEVIMWPRPTERQRGKP